MITYSEKDGVLTFRVRVVPRASRSKIVGEHDGALCVRIAAPRVAGAANEELVRTLLRVTRGAVEITAGHGSKSKQISIRSGIASILTDLSRVLKSR